MDSKANLNVSLFKEYYLMMRILTLSICMVLLSGCQALAVIGAAVVPGGIPIYIGYEAYCHNGHMQEPKCRAAMLKGEISK